MSAFATMNYRELQAECKNSGLPSGGKTADLLARLTVHATTFLSSPVDVRAFQMTIHQRRCPPQAKPAKKAPAKAKARAPATAKPKLKAPAKPKAKAPAKAPAKMRKRSTVEPPPAKKARTTSNATTTSEGNEVRLRLPANKKTGLGFQEWNGVIVVVSFEGPRKSAAAKAAGVRLGMRLAGINKQSFDGLSVEEIQKAFDACQSKERTIIFKKGPKPKKFPYGQCAHAHGCTHTCVCTCTCARV